MKTFSMTFNDQQVKVIANNEVNMVDAFKLRINLMEWLLSEYNLPGWHFECTETKLPMKHIGMCDYKNKTIYINTNNLYLLTWEMVKYVMLHEICHALTPNIGGHGKEWQDKCKELGIPPTVHLGMKNLKKISEDLYQIEL